MEKPTNAHDFPIKNAVDICMVTPDNELLLITRKHEPFLGKLVLPGGHFDTFQLDDGTIIGDQRLVIAAVREASEETGVQLKVEELTAFFDLDDLNRDPRTDARRISRVFWCRISEEQKKSACAGDDAATIVFVPLEKINKDDIGFDHYLAIEKLKDLLFVFTEMTENDRGGHKKFFHHCPEMEKTRPYRSNTIIKKFVYPSKTIPDYVLLECSNVEKGGPLDDVKSTAIEITFCPFCGKKLV